MFASIFFVFICFFENSSAVCAPGSVKQTGITPAQLNEIVNMHNNFRQQIAHGLVQGQPKASNMRKLRWDHTLASAAQNSVTNICVNLHVGIPDNNFQIGQNLHISVNPTFQTNPNWNEALSSWFNEHSLYRYPTYSSNAGHYIQIANAETIKVGCGYIQYYDGNIKKYIKLFSCNYGPAANVQKPPYLTGPGCENLC